MYGRVADPEGTGIPNARVFVAEGRHGGWITSTLTELGRGLTNADGEYNIPCSKLDAGHPMQVRSKRLIIYAEREGYSRRPRLWVRWPPISEPLQDIRMDFILEPGRWVHGRILAADGAPVPGAFVALSWDTPEDDGRWESFSSTNDDGIFRRPFPPQGVVHQLSARAWHEGVALIDLHGRDDGAEVLDLGDVVLDPGGTLSGQALFADGQPASGMQLVAVPVEVRGSVAIQERGLSPIGSLPEDGPALPHGRATSDEEGRFRMAGLRIGPYAVYARLNGGEEKHGRGSHVDTWFFTGSRNILVVVDECRLIVELIDEEGQPLSNVEVRRDLLRDGVQDQIDNRRRPPWGVTTWNGSLVFAVKPGSTYRLSAGVKRLGSARAAVAIPPNATEVRQQLVLVVDKPPE